MRMTVKHLINELQNLKPELQDKYVFVVAENGMIFSPSIKFVLKEKGNLDKTKENVDYVVLSAD